MNRTVITTGYEGVDIDGYACVVSYAELLRGLGQNPLPIVGPLNHSVTEKIKRFPVKFETKYLPLENDVFVLMDFSEPEYIPEFLKDLSKIVALYDHHFGFEKYWQAKIGANAHIEKAGACATLIWEEYEKAGMTDKISATSANLLYTAIVSNTLNFNASVTDKRDREAFEKLKQHITLPADWIETYFRDQEMTIYANPEEVIKGDTKKIAYPNLPFELVIGQLELWDSRSFIQDHLAAVEKGLSSFGNPHWFLTSPSISEGKNYLFTNNQEVKDLLERVLGVKFNDGLAQTDELVLRKEILKKLLEPSKS